MLRGNALAKVDDKGRLKLPSSFRSTIEPKYGSEFFVTSLRGDSVRIYPMQVWQEIEIDHRWSCISGRVRPAR